MEKKKDVLAIVRTICCIGVFLVVLICAVITVPKINRTVDKIEADYEQISDTVAGISRITKVLEKEIPTLVDNVQDTMDNIEVGLTDALKSINSVDIDTLNEAIGDLAAIIAPLASLFGH